MVSLVPPTDSCTPPQRILARSGCLPMASPFPPVGGCPPEGSSPPPPLSLSLSPQVAAHLRGHLHLLQATTLMEQTLPTFSPNTKPKSSVDPFLFLQEALASILPSPLSPLPPSPHQVTGSPCKALSLANSGEFFFSISLPLSGNKRDAFASYPVHFNP